jgi:hypothetical protein
VGHPRWPGQPVPDAAISPAAPVVSFARPRLGFPVSELVGPERLARGEIDEPEYTSRLAALRDRQQLRSAG